MTVKRSIKAKYKKWTDQREKSRQWTEDDIISLVDRCIKDGMQFSETTKKIESEIGRCLSCLDTSFIEIRYVQSVLDNWMRDSLDHMKRFIKNDDLSTVAQLWSDDPNFWAKISYRPPYDQLILGQKRLFQARSEEYQDEFRVRSRDLLLAKCQVDKENCDANLKFFAALVDFLRPINLHYDKEEILRCSGDGLRDGCHSLAENCTEKDIPKKLIDRFLVTLNSFEVTPESEKMFRNICDGLLLPQTTLREEKIDGRLAIKVQVSLKNKKSLFGGCTCFSLIQGASIVMSHVIDKMERKLRRSDEQVEEIHLHGLNVVHIDVDLCSDKWHGINIVVVTDKIVVHKQVIWDVSGLNGAANWNSPAKDGLEPGGDAEPGMHGWPGESGGNIRIICNEVTNASNWTLVSRGGAGGPGQNGGNGMDGGTGADGEKLTQTQFQEKFPSMSYLDDYKWYDGFCKIQNTLKDLKVTLNTNWSSDPKAVINYLEPFGIRNVQLDDIVKPETRPTPVSLFIEGKTNETDRHVIVFFSKTNFKWSGRHSLYYYQGANGSPGLIFSFHLRRFFLL